ncbi:hypothetical protein Tco_0343077 [Tanacetum coccineum]
MGNANPQLPPFPLTPPYPYNTSHWEIYAPYEPSPRMDFYDQPSCLGSNIFSEAFRKSDQVYQNLMENSLALNHELDELIESLKSLPKETNEEDLANKFCEQQDLVFLQEITNRIACRKFFQENECEFFTVSGDGVRNFPDGATSPDL